MRKPYPSDMTDAPWGIIEPMIPISTLGRPREVDMREVCNAIFDLNRSGCPWDLLPHDFPPKSTVHEWDYLTAQRPLRTVASAIPPGSA